MLEWFPQGVCWLEVKTRPSPTFDWSPLENIALAYWSKRMLKSQVVKNLLFGNEECSMGAVVISEAWWCLWTTYRSLLAKMTWREVENLTLGSTST